MKIYCNGASPEIEDGHWINPTFETPNDYTTIETFPGVLDVRISSTGEVAVFIPKLNEDYWHDGRSDVLIKKRCL